MPLADLSDSFAGGSSAAYLDELEARFRADPASVDKTWASFFKLLGASSPPRRRSSTEAASRRRPLVSVVASPLA